MTAGAASATTVCAERAWSTALRCVRASLLESPRTPPLAAVCAATLRVMMKRCPSPSSALPALSDLRAAVGQVEAASPHAALEVVAALPWASSKTIGDSPGDGKGATESVFDAAVRLCVQGYTTPPADPLQQAGCLFPRP